MIMENGKKFYFSFSLPPTTTPQTTIKRYARTFLSMIFDMPILPSQLHHHQKVTNFDSFENVNIIDLYYDVMCS